jgi:hypothetical protein
MDKFDKTLAEALGGQDDYVTPNVATDYFVTPPAGVISISVHKTTVRWWSDMESRSWGIKGFSPIVTEITGVKEIEPEDPEAATRDEDGRWTSDGYEIKISQASGSGLAPINVSIDENNKTIEVIFGLGL